MQGVRTLWDGISGEDAGTAGTVAESHDGGIKVKVDMPGIFREVAVMGSSV